MPTRCYLRALPAYTLLIHDFALTCQLLEAAAAAPVTADAAAVGQNRQLATAQATKDRKRRRETQNRRTAAGGPEPEVYQPPPPTPDVRLPFLEPVLQVRPGDALALPSCVFVLTCRVPATQAPGFQMPAAVCGMRGRARIGRGGRLIFDRVDPITREPFSDPVKFSPTRHGALMVEDAQ